MSAELTLTKIKEALVQGRSENYSVRATCYEITNALIQTGTDEAYGILADHMGYGNFGWGSFSVIMRAFQAVEKFCSDYPERGIPLVMRVLGNPHVATRLAARQILLTAEKPLAAPPKKHWWSKTPPAPKCLHSCINGCLDDLEMLANSNNPSAIIPLVEALRYDGLQPYYNDRHASSYSFNRTQLYHGRRWVWNAVLCLPTVIGSHGSPQAIEQLLKLQQRLNENRTWPESENDYAFRNAVDKALESLTSNQPQC